MNRQKTLQVLRVNYEDELIIMELLSSISLTSLKGQKCHHYVLCCTGREIDQIISEQSDDEEAEDVPPTFTYTNDADQLPDMDEEEDIRDAKLQTLKELFPQRSDQELLQSKQLGPNPAPTEADDFTGERTDH